MYKHPIPVVLICSLFATGCGGPAVLSNENRQRIHSVAVTLSEPRKETIYMDKSTGMLAMGLGFGVVGGLAGAANMAAGESRFSPVTEPHRAALSAIVTAKMNNALQRAGKKAGTPDATLAVKGLSFGVTHTGHQRFAAVVAGAFKLTLPNGETVLEPVLSATSDQRFARTEAQADPRIYRSALEEVAEKLADQFVSRFGSENSASEH
jgi:hypothetical protein